MKLFKMILIIFIILVIIGIAGIFIFLKTFDIDRFKPQIISGISTAIGRRVDFDDIDLQVSIKEGIYLTMENLVIHGDVDFQSGDFLTVKNISLGVEIMPFLTTRRIFVSSVHIQSPHCVIVRKKDGQINVQNLGKSKFTKKSFGEAVSSNDVQDTKSTKISQAAVPTLENHGLKSTGEWLDRDSMSIPFIFAEIIEVENGKVTYVDRAVESKDSLEISRVHLKINGFSLTKAFSFQIDSAVLGEQENVHVKGEIRINIQNNQVRLKNIEIETDLSQLSLKKIRGHLPLPKETPFPDALKGTLKSSAKEIVISPEGITSIMIDAQWRDGALNFIELTPGTSLNISQIELSLKNFSLKEPFIFDLQAAYLSDQPNIQFKGEAAINPETKNYKLKDTTFQTNLSVLSLAQMKTSLKMLKDLPLPEELGGDLNLKIKQLEFSKEGLTALLLDAQLQDGEVNFPELTKDISFQVSHLGLKVTDFSLSDPFSFDLQAAYLSEQPNIELNGNAVINTKTHSITLNNTKLTTELSSLSLPKLQSSFAMLNKGDLPQQIRGDFSAIIEQMEIGTKGLMTLKSRVELSEGLIKQRLVSLPLDPVQLNFHITESNIDIAQLSLGLGKGSLRAQGKLDDYGRGQDFDFDVYIQDLNLEEILNQEQQPVKLQGFLEGEFKAQGKGLSMDHLRDDLLGEGFLEIKEGRLKDINVLQIVLDKMSMIPDLAAKVEASLPERYKEILTQKDTILTKVKTEVSVQGGVALLNPMAIEADGFLFLGKGRINFDQRFSLDGIFFIPEDLAASMAGIVSELQYLLDEKGDIRISLSVSGKAPDIKFAVDLEYIGKKMLKSRASDEINKVLDKWLGKKPPPVTDNSDATDAPQEPEKSLERELIENVFDAIFQ